MKKSPFSSLSVSGGILNIEKAFEMALVTPGKKITTSKRSVSIKGLYQQKKWWFLNPASFILFKNKMVASSG